MTQNTENLWSVWLSKVPEFGVEIYSINVFKRAIESGLLVEDDGEGYYMPNENTESDISTWLADNPPFWATHVAWYNK